MERQQKVLREANKIVKKEEKREKRRRRFTKARNVALLVTLATAITATEVAVINQSSNQQVQPSCLESPFQVDCNWNPMPTSVPTHTPVPEHESTPLVNQHVR